MSRPFKICPELISQIAASIREGCFPVIAAGKNGVSSSAHYKWLAGKQPLHKQYQQAVESAMAIARHDAETRLFRTDPHRWLKAGPGKPGGHFFPLEGWTEENRVVHSGGVESVLRIEYDGPAPAGLIDVTPEPKRLESGDDSDE